MLRAGTALAVSPLVLALLLLGPRPTSAQATDALERAETAAGEGDFEQAIQLLETVTHDPTQHTAELARAYMLLGVVQSTLGDDASRAFEWALALDPGMPTPAELGPTQRQTLDRLRASRRGRALAVTLDAPASSALDAVLTLAATADGAPTGATLHVEITAWPDDDEAQALSADGVGAASLAVPSGAWPSAQTIHVRVEATSDAGAVVAYRDTRVPRTGAPSDGGGGGSVFEEAWFWVVVGVVVLGGVTAAILATQLPQGTTLGRPELVP